MKIICNFCRYEEEFPHRFLLDDPARRAYSDWICPKCKGIPPPGPKAKLKIVYRHPTQAYEEVLEERVLPREVAERMASEIRRDGYNGDAAAFLQVTVEPVPS